MAKDKVTVTIDPQVLADADADAAAADLNRSTYFESVLREAHYRRQLATVSAPPAMPAGEEGDLRALLTWQRDLGSAA
jgi:hypothetical protein